MVVLSPGTLLVEAVLQLGNSKFRIILSVGANYAIFSYEGMATFQSNKKKKRRKNTCMASSLLSSIFGFVKKRVR